MRFLLTILATLSISIIVAQELPNVAVGIIQDGSQVSLISEPRSTVVVDMQLSAYYFTAGEYARYAQKYLGERAPLSDRVSNTIEGATITLAPANHIYAAPTTAPIDRVTSTKSPAQGLSPERTSPDVLSTEQRAESCAQRIFANRRLARDLISGDVGEGVFGAGLSSVLERLDREESECLKQFMGSEYTSQYSRRVTINIRPDATRYMVGRLDLENGFTSPNSIDGEAIYLQITPAATQDSVYNFSVGKEPLKSEFVSPNYSHCDLYVGANIVATIELPLYEFGSRTTIIYDKK